MRLNSRWFQGVDDPDSLRIKIGNSRIVLDHLRDLLIRDLEALESPKLSDYDVGHWPALQADKNGQARALRNVIAMLTINEETTSHE